MKTGTLDKIKFMRLSMRLGLPRYAVIGLLEGLWYLTSTSAIDGGIGRFANDEIAAWLEWPGDPDELIRALVATGWIDDVGGDVRLAIHDWEEHCSRTVRGNVARWRGNKFAGCAHQAPTNVEFSPPAAPPKGECMVKNREAPRDTPTVANEAPRDNPMEDPRDNPGEHPCDLPPNQTKPNQTKPNPTKPNQTAGDAGPVGWLAGIVFFGPGEQPGQAYVDWVPPAATVETWRARWPAMDVVAELRGLSDWARKDPDRVPRPSERVGWLESCLAKKARQGTFTPARTAEVPPALRRDRRLEFEIRRGEIVKAGRRAKAPDAEIETRIAALANSLGIEAAIA